MRPVSANISWHNMTKQKICWFCKHRIKKGDEINFLDSDGCYKSMYPGCELAHSGKLSEKEQERFERIGQREKDDRAGG